MEDKHINVSVCSYHHRVNKMEDRTKTIGRIIKAKKYLDISEELKQKQYSYLTSKYKQENLPIHRNSGDEILEVEGDYEDGAGRTVADLAQDIFDQLFKYHKKERIEKSFWQYTPLMGTPDAPYLLIRGVLKETEPAGQIERVTNYDSERMFIPRYVTANLEVTEIHVDGTFNSKDYTQKIKEDRQKIDQKKNQELINAFNANQSSECMNWGTHGYRFDGVSIRPVKEFVEVSPWNEPLLVGRERYGNTIDMYKMIKDRDFRKLDENIPKLVKALKKEKTPDGFSTSYDFDIPMDCTDHELHSTPFKQGFISDFPIQFWNITRRYTAQKPNQTKN